MIEIEKPQIECIETPGDATYGKYVVEPLERGYGTTLGNALRRIMLSSLPGTAPTTIKIAGVQHEFSTIPGVKEDVTEIVLNVKGLLTKLHCETVKTVYIEAVGPCEVKAGDIKADGEVEVLNPDMHIATLDNGKKETTLARAKEIKPLAEKMITLGKKSDLAAYRQAMSFITREDVCKKLFKEIAPSYAERNGGYTRVIRTGVRRGDAAETAIIELVK